jgi:hypothetical protein
MTSIGREESRVATVTVSSGAGTALVPRTWGIARRIRVIPATESHVFDVKIRDTDGDLIFSRTDQEGSLSEIAELSLGIAYDVVFSNATDGLYKIKFDMH